MNVLDGAGQTPAQPPRLAVKNLVKTFGDAFAVRGVSFDVAAGECLALLGPSGCGKTTALRCIAGLEDPSGGEILIEGKPVWNAQGVNVPTNHRLLGMMFQSYALWPHLTVGENVEYPLRYFNWPKAERRDRLVWALDLVGLGHRIAAYPSELSGGQQQRVALARSIVAEPKILLFDEPLANLDRRLREAMRTDLRALLDRVGITSIFVTHDQSEAFALADRVAVMRDGLIVQIGSALDIYRRPEDAFVAAFVGHTNFLPARVTGQSGQVVSVVDPAGVSLRLNVAGVRPFERDDDVSLLMRPEHITVAAQAAPTGADEYSFVATVERVLYLGSSFELLVTRGQDKIRAAILAHLVDEHAASDWLAPGRQVVCSVRLRDLSLLHGGALDENS